MARVRGRGSTAPPTCTSARTRKRKGRRRGDPVTAVPAERYTKKDDNAAMLSPPSRLPQATPAEKDKFIDPFVKVSAKVTLLENRRASLNHEMELHTRTMRPLQQDQEELRDHVEELEVVNEIFCREREELDEKVDNILEKLSEVTATLEAKQNSLEKVGVLFEELEEIGEIPPVLNRVVAGGGWIDDPDTAGGQLLRADFSVSGTENSVWHEQAVVVFKGILNKYCKWATNSQNKSAGADRDAAAVKKQAFEKKGEVEERFKFRQAEMREDWDSFFQAPCETDGAEVLDPNTDSKEEEPAVASTKKPRVTLPPTYRTQQVWMSSRKPLDSRLAAVERKEREKGKNKCNGASPR
ncbi:hypothetical protein C8F04DRAFT_1188027 [Mycena alexandri]|uniref:Uncharacterized protein n=1 Tax=Mycena alexandri TaxID=1745969 RepID=A0AAD6SNU2_9AGAR|nr:hypothetical protein C8F04DRAFT_1188027 [Mycena alexandri]